MARSPREQFPLRRMTSFIALPLLSAVIPIAVVPLLVRSLGADGWASIAIGMSVGAAGSIIVSWGWGLVGPAEVAKATVHEASEIYSVSFAMRAFLSLPVGGVVFAIAQALDQSPHGVSAGLMAIATAIGGLSPAWYFVGVGRAAGVALWDTAPRLLSAALSIPILILLPDGTWYAVLNLIVCGGTWVAAGLALGRPGRLKSFAEYRTRVADALRDQWSITLSGIISGGYTSLTVAIVGGVNFSAVASFAAADRFRAMAKQGEMSVANGLQAWVGSANPSQQSGRMMRSVTLMATAGFIAGGIFAIGMPLAAPLLLGSAVHVDPLTCAFMGLALFMTGISISASLHVLAPLRRRHTISIATTIGAVVGVPVVAFGGAWFGSAGASAGLALAEMVVVAIQLPVAVRLIRARRAG